jgi:VanZ family protein
LPNREKITPWLAVLAWGTVIFLLSTERFGGAHTGAVILPILHVLFPSATPHELAALHQDVRKLAHFVEYFVLGLLLHRALGGRGPWTVRTAVVAVAFAAVWASLDEASQMLAEGRVAAPADVALDVSGAVAAQLVLVFRDPGRLFRAAVPPRSVL